MGALARATEYEIEEIVAGDPHWWTDTLGKVASEGIPALRAEAQARGWAWNATWAWVTGDEDRHAALKRALEAKAQLLGWDTIAIAQAADPETVQVAKLQVDTAFKVAGRVDRHRWGEHTKVEHTGSVSLIALLSSLPSGEIAPAQAQVIEHEQQPALLEMAESIAELGEI